MSRYIDIEPYEKDGWYLQKRYHNEHCEVVKTTPLASVPTAEPVVRCKDCKYCLIHDKTLFCGYWGNIGEWRYRTETDFCSRGERKEGSND